MPLAPKEKILIENKCKDNLIQHIPMEVLTLILNNMELYQLFTCS